MSVQLRFVGQIRTPYQSLDECPRNINPQGPECQLQLGAEYWNEVRGLKPGQPILILYWLESIGLAVEPKDSRGRRDWKLASDRHDQGVFALRTPLRPNPIGAAVLPIERLDHGAVWVRGLDCLDRTALLDIKPAIYRELSPTLN